MAYKNIVQSVRLSTTTTEKLFPIPSFLCHLLYQVISLVYAVQLMELANVHKLMISNR